MRTLLFLLATTIHCFAIGLQSHVFISATVQPAAGGASFPSGATHYWTLDEASGTRNDSVGTTHLAATTAVASGTGKDSNAAQFDWNGTDFGSLAGSVDITVPSAFSLSGWFKFSAVDASQILEVQGVTAGIIAVGISYSASGDFINFKLHEEDNLQFNITPDTSWHLVCVTASGTTATIYLDGTSVASNPSATIDYSDWDTFTVSAFNGIATSGTVGLVDEISFWPLQLTAQNVTDMWNSGTGRFGP